MTRNPTDPPNMDRNHPFSHGYRIDLGPEGRDGVEAQVRHINGRRVLYIYGSDHPNDWKHHVTPGARQREEIAAHKLALLTEGQVDAIAGHSMGGGIARMVAAIHRAANHRVALYVYGGKRAPRGYETHGDFYRHRGDIVPWLPPWRPRYRNTMKIGRWTWPWIAHKPRSYAQQMKRDGVRQ